MSSKRAPAGELLRFVMEVALPFEGDECLIWPFGRSGDGRGQMRFKGKKRGTHRVVCELAHGPAPTPDHEAAHSCGKGHLGCVNKRHLSWKTHEENLGDKLIHGTDPRGERNPNAKLSADDVARIRALKGKLTQREIGRRFGTCLQNVRKIQSGERWRATSTSPSV